MRQTKLEDIGFYTLNDKRAATACHSSPLSRCEVVLTSKCNFSCPYCRSVGGSDMTLQESANLVKRWAADGLKNIRFSGGEPTLYPNIIDLCAIAKQEGIERIAMSTNGSANKQLYSDLLRVGVDDFSISMDACCAEDGDKMAGGIKGSWDIVIDNIRWLSSRAYVTVGVVLTADNADSCGEIIKLADELGVSDIRIIPAAQAGDTLATVEIDKYLLEKYPILTYRIENIDCGVKVRGIEDVDSRKCGLVLDDMAVNHEKHYPCIIYMREGGEPIGVVGGNMRAERLGWYNNHDTHTDPICSGNCLDVCVNYNNKFGATNPLGKSYE